MKGPGSGYAPWRAWDVFVSYKRQDQPRAEALAQALRDSGFDVWWDRDIPPGAKWPRVIEESLDVSSAIIVLWTDTSVQDDADWVHIEARRANRRNVLIPVAFDGVEPPLEFSNLQATSLADWETGSDAQALDPVMARVSELVRADERERRSPDEVAMDVRRWWRARQARRHRRTALVALLALVWTGLVGGLLFVPSPWTPMRLDDMSVASIKTPLAEGVRVETDRLRVRELIVSAQRRPFQSVRVRRGEPSVTLLDTTATVVHIRDGGGGAALWIDQIPIRSGTFELRRDDADWRIRSPRGLANLTLTGSWHVRIGESRDTMTLDFGSRGGTIEITSDRMLNLDFKLDQTNEEQVVLSQVPITDIEFSDYVPQSGRQVASPTVLGGRLTGPGGLDERLTNASALGFDSFEGTLSRLWFRNDDLHATIVGNRVTGLRIDGQPRMPGVLQARSTLERWAVAIGMALLLWGILAWGRRRTGLT